jgi:chromosome segregation ATPase
MKRYIPIIFAALLLAACASTGAVVPPQNESAGEYRELQGELYHQQADIAVTGQKIEDQGRGLVEDLTRLEDSLANAAPDSGEAERRYWLSLVQDTRTAAETHVSEIENLNLKLEEERETSRKKEQKFNEYEAAITGKLAALDTENAELKETVKTVKGQRNTLLSIVLTALGLILSIIGVKVLRTLKIIRI